MAPEQWGSETYGRISARTDVYSLGVLLFRLLTGVSLFPGETVNEQMFAHCFTSPRRPTEVRPDLDPRLDDLCVRALAKQQSERYRSANDRPKPIRRCRDHDAPTRTGRPFTFPGVARAIAR